MSPCRQLFGAPPERPVVVAHRGASAHVRENTIAAFELAIRQKADAIECDVRLTANGIPVLHHDEALPGESEPLSGMTLSEAETSAREAAFELATLEQTLRLCAGKIALNIELKETGYEEDIVSMCRRYMDDDHLLFSSFASETVRACKRVAPDCCSGLLLDLSTAPDLLRRKEGLSLKTRLAECLADCVLPHWTLMRYGFSRLLNNLRLPIVVWTVNRPALVRLMIRKGVSGIITDRPDIVRHALSGDTSF